MKYLIGIYTTLLIFILFPFQIQAQNLSDLIEELVYADSSAIDTIVTETSIFDFELIDADSSSIFAAGPVDSLPPESPLIRFYLERDFEAAWYEEGDLLNRADSLLNIIKAAPQHGLSPEYYNYQTLQQQYDELNNYKLQLYMTDPKDLAAFDVELTKATLQYVSDIHYGKLDPEALELQWEVPQDSKEIYSKLQQVLEAPTLAEGVESLHSSNMYYQRLLKALRKLDKSIERRKTYNPTITVSINDSTTTDSTVVYSLEKKQKLAVGDSSIQVALLRKHLGFYFPELLDSSANIISVVYDTIHMRTDSIANDTIDERVFLSSVCRDTIYAKPDSVYILLDSSQVSFDTNYVKIDTFTTILDSLNLLSSDSVYNPGIFDSTLLGYVKKYQKQFGLEPDGVIGPQTLKSLTGNPDDLRMVLEINLDRWRRLPKNLDGRYIIVNIAGYYMDVFIDDTSDLHKQVMVGNPRTSTPVFSDVMHYIDLNPTWTVPYSIASREMLPKVKKDPSYLTRNNYEVLSGGKNVNVYSIDWESLSRSNLPYTFRQKPGSNNALGIVKFMFPNRYNIYLHDTPSKHLFVKPYRAFSHGCIRLEKPMELAHYLFKDDPKWTKEKLDATLNKRKNKRINLATPVPIYLLYFTAWVNDQEELFFLPDVYKRDNILLEAWK